MRRLILLLALLGLPSAALAQFSYRGEVELSADATLSDAFPAQVGWTLAGHLAGDYDLPPLTFRVVLDPSARFSQELSFEPGVTEVYAFTTQGDVDISVGKERLPLETARLNLPYSVEPVGRRGIRQGVLGARASYYSGDWRFRGAVFYHPGAESLAPLMSARRTFGSFELEAHALYAGGFSAGIGGSGLAGDLVLYGEAWLLSDPLELRGALGLTGNLGRGLWTLEAAYLPPDLERVTGEPDANITAQQLPNLGPRPVIGGQLSWPVDEQGDESLTLMAGASFDTDALRARVSGSYTVLSENQAVTVNIGVVFGPEPTTLALSLSVRQFL